MRELGAGIAGVGIVNDWEGDEQYQTIIGGQGFGIYGVGMLVDGGGSDRYAGGLLIQGAAGPGGGGVLLDVRGNDVYDAGGVYRDFREGGAFFQSRSMGRWGVCSELGLPRVELLLTTVLRDHRVLREFPGVGLGLEGGR